MHFEPVESLSQRREHLPAKSDTVGRHREILVHRLADGHVRDEKLGRVFTRYGDVVANARGIASFVVDEQIVENLLCVGLQGWRARGRRGNGRLCRCCRAGGCRRRQRLSEITIVLVRGDVGHEIGHGLDVASEDFVEIFELFGLLVARVDDEQTFAERELVRFRLLDHVDVVQNAVDEFPRDRQVIGGLRAWPNDGIAQLFLGEQLLALVVVDVHERRMGNDTFDVATLLGGLLRLFLLLDLGDIVRLECQIVEGVLLRPPSVGIVA